MKDVTLKMRHLLLQTVLKEQHFIGQRLLGRRTRQLEGRHLRDTRKNRLRTDNRRIAGCGVGKVGERLVTEKSAGERASVQRKGSKV